MKEINLEVTTPSKTAFSGQIKSITVPGSKGNFQILYNHAPIMSALDIGFIKITGLDDIKTVYATSGGTVEVSNNKIIILAETFEAPEDIDLERANNAKLRAEERIKDHSSSVDHVRAQAALARSINRIRLVS